MKSREWNALFQKYFGKLREKCYRSFILDLVNIYVGVKPSLLFDYAVIDSTNSIILIDALVSGGLVPYPLDVLKVGDDIFFTDLKYLVSHLKTSVEFEELTLVDVSGKLPEPCLLETETSKTVKKQFLEIVDILDEKLQHQSSNLTRGDEEVRNSQVIDLNIAGENDNNCCIPCVFGFLLGYPVIYWCDQATCSNHNCLSMVPLNRYTVTVKASSLIHSRVLQNNKRLIQAGCGRKESCVEHTVFSFTAPVALESHYESKVDRWIRRICDTGKKLGIGEDLTAQKTIVSLTQVTL